MTVTTLARPAEGTAAAGPITGKAKVGLTTINKDRGICGPYLTVDRDLADLLLTVDDKPRFAVTWEAGRDAFVLTPDPNGRLMSRNNGDDPMLYTSFGDDLRDAAGLPSVYIKPWSTTARVENGRIIIPLPPGFRALAERQVVADAASPRPAAKGTLKGVVAVGDAVTALKQAAQAVNIALAQARDAGLTPTVLQGEDGTVRIGLEV